jgi:hypothetical protein
MPLNQGLWEIPRIRAAKQLPGNPADPDSRCRSHDNYIVVFISDMYCKVTWSACQSYIHEKSVV